MALVPLSLGEEYIGQVVVGLGIVWLNFKGFLELLNGLRGLAPAWQAGCPDYRKLLREPD